MTPPRPSHVLSRDDVVDVVDRMPSAIPVSVAMTDLDGFGAFNDATTREEGDAALANFEAALLQNLVDGATVHRVGGDEWVIVFAGQPLENSLVLMHELRTHIEQLGLGNQEHPVTLSAGLASRPPHGSTGDELLRCADEALSRSKREGRNRVGIFVEDKMVMKSNYYSRATLDRLASLAKATNRTEASLLREAADDLLARYAAEM